MEIAKQVSTGDFLIKGNETEMELFKELFDKNQEMTKQIAKREESEEIFNGLILMAEQNNKPELKSLITFYRQVKVDISKNKISKK
jgi:hypothetical protein